jgi:hypothetical protein
MKMGTIASPWRYDEAAADAIRPDNQRRTAILRRASWAVAFPISRVVMSSFDCGHFDQSRGEQRDGPLPDARSGVLTQSELFAELHFDFLFLRSDNKPAVRLGRRQ